MTIRAKVLVESVIANEASQSQTVTMRPVTSGSDENKSFSKYTPAGLVQLVISEETAAYDQFIPGREYYVDFTPAPQA